MQSFTEIIPGSCVPTFPCSVMVYPFKKGELKKLLKEAGFQKIEQYSDYQPGDKPEADFYMYVCQK